MNEGETANEKRHQVSISMPLVKRRGWAGGDRVAIEFEIGGEGDGLIGPRRLDICTEGFSWCRTSKDGPQTKRPGGPGEAGQARPGQDRTGLTQQQGTQGHRDTRNAT